MSASCGNELAWSSAEQRCSQSDTRRLQAPLRNNMAGTPPADSRQMQMLRQETQRSSHCRGRVKSPLRTGAAPVFMQNACHRFCYVYTDN